MRAREITGITLQKIGVHIWLGSLPERFSYETSDWLTYSIDMKKSAAFTESRSVGLRLRLHDFSGLLGATFIPQEDKALRIKVGVADLEIPGLLIRKGIPADFAQVVMDEAVRTAGEFDFLGTGTLEFSHGGFDPVYSSEKLFRFLAQGILWLLDPNLEAAQDEQIIAVVDRSISGQQ